MYIDHTHLLLPLNSSQYPPPSQLHVPFTWLLITLSPVTVTQKHMGVCPSNIPAATFPEESNSFPQQSPTASSSYDRTGAPTPSMVEFSLS